LSPTARRSLAVLAVLLMTGCSGGSSAPPPAASPTPNSADEGLKPLTSREGAPPTGAAGAGEALPPGHPPLEGLSGAPVPPAASGASVSGTIALSAELAGRASSGDVLYVMAKKDGTTLAVQRLESPRFPAPFEVSEGHAMVAGTTLEGPVDIVARLSKTGDAIASAGDLEGATSGVAVPAEGVTVTIDQIRQ
jgi:cytochrome c-type biogenesis protein CcmH